MRPRFAIPCMSQSGSSLPPHTLTHTPGIRGVTLHLKLPFKVLKRKSKILKFNTVPNGKMKLAMILQTCNRRYYNDWSFLHDKQGNWVYMPTGLFFGDPQCHLTLLTHLTKARSSYRSSYPLPTKPYTTPSRTHSFTLPYPFLGPSSPRTVP